MVRKLLVSVVVLLLAATALGIILWRADWAADLDAETVALRVDTAGAWGPAAIVGLMALAAVASPIPSAPIALAAGAAYGHYARTLYVATDAELGALVAFAIARTRERTPRPTKGTDQESGRLPILPVVARPRRASLAIAPTAHMKSMSHPLDLPVTGGPTFLSKGWDSHGTASSSSSRRLRHRAGRRNRDRPGLRDDRRDQGRRPQPRLLR